MTKPFVLFGIGAPASTGDLALGNFPLFADGVFQHTAQIKIAADALVVPAIH